MTTPTGRQTTADQGRQEAQRRHGRTPVTKAREDLDVTRLETSLSDFRRAPDPGFTTLKYNAQRRRDDAARWNMP